MVSTGIPASPQSGTLVMGRNVFKPILHCSALHAILLSSLLCWLVCCVKCQWYGRKFPVHRLYRIDNQLHPRAARETPQYLHAFFGP